MACAKEEMQLRLQLAQINEDQLDCQTAQHACGHPTGPGEDSLHRIIDAMVDWILENDLYARIILREIMENDERVQSAHQLPLREGMQVVYRAVRTAIDADPEDQISELLSLQLLGAAFLFYTGQPTHRSQAAVSVVGWEESFRALLKQTAACAIKVAKTSGRL